MIEGALRLRDNTANAYGLMAGALAALTTTTQYSNGKLKV
jgi:hypothetical protein